MSTCAQGGDGSSSSASWRRCGRRVDRGAVGWAKSPGMSSPHETTWQSDFAHGDMGQGATAWAKSPIRRAKLATIREAILPTLRNKPAHRLHRGAVGKDGGGQGLVVKA